LRLVGWGYRATSPDAAARRPCHMSCRAKSRHL
jgi:hypothetical protein